MTSMSVTASESPDCFLLSQIPLSTKTKLTVLSLSVSGRVVGVFPSHALTVSMQILARRPYCEMFEQSLSGSTCSSHVLTALVVSSSTPSTMFRRDPCVPSNVLGSNSTFAPRTSRVPWAGENDTDFAIFVMTKDRLLI